MLSDLTTISSASVRRFACDRCKRQKLRCLRDGQNQHCDRCVRADIDCLTSPPFRMGRPRSQKTFTPLRCGPTGTACALSKANRRQNRFQRRGDAEARFLRQPESATTILEAIEETHIYNFPENILDKATPQISVQEWEPQMDTTPAEAMPFRRAPQAIPGSNQENLDFATDLIMDELTCFENPGVFSLGMDDQCSGEEFHSNSGPDIITACYYEPEVFNESLKSSLHPEKDLYFRTSSSADTRFEFQSVQEVAKTGDSHINHLTGLSLRLAETLGKINGGRPSTTLDTLLFPTLDATSSPSTSTPIDEILGVTREFVKILAGLKPSNANNKSSSGSSVYGFMRSKGTAPMDGANENGDSYAGSNRAHSPMANRPPSILLTNVEQSCLERGNINATVVLQSMICYIHLVRLYVVLFSHIEIFLAEIALRDDPFICPIPHMTLSGLPLESGNLQAMILIQIATHFFDKIERQLGLTQENGLSERGGHYTGLLSDDEYAEIVKVMTREDETGKAENGGGGIKCLRDLIKRSKQLLEERIAS